MAGPDVSLVVRVSANLDQMRARLAEATAIVDTTTSAMKSMANAYDGSRTIANANAAFLQVQALGGVAKLTEADQAKLNATLTEGLAKYAALGREAPAGMQALADATKHVSAETSKWAEFIHGFNVEAALANPLGTAKEAMTAFAATLGPTGAAAAGLVVGLAAVGTAIFELAERAAATGGQLNDMSEKTGLSVPALSRLSLAAQVAGSDLSTLSNALFMLQRGIGEDSPKIESGLNKIGLTLGELKAAGVDNYLSLIAKHFKETEDPAKLAAAAMELFNRQGREITPTLMKLDEALLATNDIHPWTETQAREAEQFEMQMKSLKVHVDSVTTVIGRELIPVVGALVAQLKDAFLEELAKAKVVMFGLTEQIGAAGVVLDYFLGRTAEVPKVTGPATQGVRDWHAAATDLSLKIPTLNEALATTRDVQRDLDVETKKNIESMKHLREEAEKVAIFYMKTQLDQELANDKAWRDRLERELTGSGQIHKSEAELADFIAKTSLDSLNYQILKIWERVDQEEASFKGSEAQRAQYNKVVEALATEQAQALRDAADAAAAATERAAAREVAAIKTVILTYAQQIDALFAVEQARVRALEKANPTGGDLESVGTRPPGIGDPGFVTPGFSNGGLHPLRDAGGPVTAGQSYLIGMNRQPELFTPGASGFISPLGGNGGGETYITIQVNGTGADVARQIDDYLTRRMRALRKWQSA